MQSRSGTGRCVWTSRVADNGRRLQTARGISSRGQHLGGRRFRAPRAAEELLVSARSREVLWYVRQGLPRRLQAGRVPGTRGPTCAREDQPQSCTGAICTRQSAAPSVTMVGDMRLDLPANAFATTGSIAPPLRSPRRVKGTVWRRKVSNRGILGGRSDGFRLLCRMSGESNLSHHAEIRSNDQRWSLLSIARMRPREVDDVPDERALQACADGRMRPGDPT